MADIRHAGTLLVKQGSYARADRFPQRLVWLTVHQSFIRIQLTSSFNRVFKPGDQTSPCKKGARKKIGQGEKEMARFEIGSAEMAPMGQNAVNAESFFELGLSTSDLVAAHKWFNLAAMKGNQEAARYRQEIAAEMSGPQVAEAQRAAREWLRTH
jgi:hypothetical protein